MMIPTDTLVTERTRAELRAHFAALPHPQASAQADLLADLVVLAVRNAVDAVDRVAGSADTHGARMCVLSASVSTGKAVFGLLEDALQTYAKQSGAQVYSSRMSLGGGK